MKSLPRETQSSKAVVLASLKAREAALVGELEGLRQTIRGVELYATDAEAGRPGPVMKAATSPSQARQQSGPRKAASKQPGPVPPAGRNAIREAARAAMVAQTKPWSTIDLRAFLDTQFPALAPKISSGRLSQEIYTARIDGLIKYHTKGPPGGAHTYVTIFQTT